MPDLSSLKAVDAERVRREARLAKQRDEDRAAKEAGLPTAKERSLANRRNNVFKAQAALKLKRDQREHVRKKVELGMPITPEEQELLAWRYNVKQKGKKAQQEALLATASKLLINPTTVKELRALVDKVATKHSYNPLEELIIMTQVDPVTGNYRLPADERAAIHRALLPYLTPALKVAPAKEEPAQDSGVKVTIQSFVLPPEDSKKIYDAPRNSSVTTPGSEPIQ